MNNNNNFVLGCIHCYPGLHVISGTEAGHLSLWIKHSNEGCGDVLDPNRKSQTPLT